MNSLDWPMEVLTEMLFTLLEQKPKAASMTARARVAAMAMPKLPKVADRASLAARAEMAARRSQHKNLAFDATVVILF